MRSLILISTIFISTGIYGQDFVGTDFLNFDMKSSNWDSEFSKADSIYSEAGNLLFVRAIEDGIKMNYRFDEVVRWIMKYEVTTQHFVDTTYTLDIDTGEMLEKITTGFRDIPNGKFESRMNFKESWASFNGTQNVEEYDQILGEYKMGVMYNVWSIRMSSEQVLVSVELNEDGRVEGEYKEIYLHNDQVKWIGQYGIAEFYQTYFDLDTGEEGGVLLEGSIRTGTWKRYSDWDDSKLTDEIEYRHY